MTLRTHCFDILTQSSSNVGFMDETQSALFIVPDGNVTYDREHSRHTGTEGYKHYSCYNEKAMIFIIVVRTLDTMERLAVSGVLPLRHPGTTVLAFSLWSSNGHWFKFKFTVRAPCVRHCRANS